jgi:hypothetical protein
MKPKLNLKNNNKPGQGHQARIAAVLKASVEIDGKKQDFNLEYDLTITVEMIDYAVRLFAGRIAQVADKIAKDGISRTAQTVT